MSCFGRKQRLNNLVPAPDFRLLRQKYVNFSRQELQELFELYEGKGMNCPYMWITKSIIFLQEYAMRKDCFQKALSLK
jgi:hypothetical protein